MREEGEIGWTSCSRACSSGSVSEKAEVRPVILCVDSSEGSRVRQLDGLASWVVIIGGDADHE
jgi:hypothetical protein